VIDANNNALLDRSGNGINSVISALPKESSEPAKKR
jgi:hypothetical protein